LCGRNNLQYREYKTTPPDSSIEKLNFYVLEIYTRNTGGIKAYKMKLFIVEQDN